MNLSGLGAELRAGDLLGSTRVIKRTGRDRVEITGHASGVLLSGHGPSLVRKGDFVAVVSHYTAPRTHP